MYRRTNSGRLFSDELANWLIDESGFIQFTCQMYIYYKYALDGSKLVVLYCVDDCVYLYTYEDLGKWFVDTLGNIFHMKLIEYAHWFMSIRILQLKYHSISMDKARYATYVVENYLDTATIKENRKFHNITLPNNIIFTKEDASTSD